MYVRFPTGIDAAEMIAAVLEEVSPPVAIMLRTEDAEKVEGIKEFPAFDVEEALYLPREEMRKLAAVFVLYDSRLAAAAVETVWNVLVGSNSVAYVKFC